MSALKPIIETVQPDDPTLAVQLKVLPPVEGETYGGSPRHGDWTLDLIERTCLEFRAAGAWDESVVTLKSYPPSLSCEVLAGRGNDAMPWGWRPSQGPPAHPEGPPAHPEEPPRTRLRDRQIAEVIPAALGNRVFHGLLLLTLVVLAVAL